MTENEFDSLVAPVKALLIRKSQDYGQQDLHSYFPFGDKSYTQMLHTKAKRLVSLVQSERTPNFEGIEDTVIDMINYCVFYLDYIQRNKK